MSGNVRTFVWNAQKRRAAILLAEDELTDAEIAARVGITDRQLRRWKVHPDFRDYIEQVGADLETAARRSAIGRRVCRLRELDDRWRRMQQVIEERAASTEMATVPGGKTGLLVKQVKSVRLGKDFQAIEEYAVDTALLKELRDHEKQAAKELGQWLESR